MQSKHKQRVQGAVVAVLVFLTGFAVGSWDDPLAFARTEPLDQYTTLDTFAQVLAQIEKTYVEDVEQRDLVYDAIKGMVRSLDPHSAFLTPEELASLKERTEGKYVGVGIEVGIRDNRLTVIAPIPGGSAAEQGVQTGDVITHIEGEPTETMSLEDAVQRVRGEAGTTISLTLEREGEEEPVEVTLERRNIELQSVESLMLESGYGYIAVRSFTRNVTSEVRAAHAALVEQNGDEALAGLILDLRNNPGGLLREAVLLSNAFVSSGLIVSTEGRSGFELARHDASRGNAFIDSPVVVLVNGGSASASEIVAGALQDHQRAVIVGTRTFGKGSVQNIYDLDDGSGMKLTVARYFTPAHRSIQAEGIAPDIIVEDVEVPDGEVMPTLNLRERDLPGALDAKDKPEVEEAPVTTDATSTALMQQMPVRTALDQLKAYHILKQH